MAKPIKQEVQQALRAIRAGKPPKKGKIAYLLGTSYFLWSVGVLEERLKLNSELNCNLAEVLKDRCSELWDMNGQYSSQNVLNTLAKYDVTLNNEISLARWMGQSDDVTAKRLFAKYGAAYTAAIPDQLTGSQKEVYDSITRGHTIELPKSREGSITKVRDANNLSMYGTPKKEREEKIARGFRIKLGTNERLKMIAERSPWLRERAHDATAQKFDREKKLSVITAKFYRANKLPVISEVDAEQGQDESYAEQKQKESSLPYAQNFNKPQNKPTISPVQKFENDLLEETNKLKNGTSSSSESEQCRLLIFTYFLCSRADPSLLRLFWDKNGSLTYEKTLKTFGDLKDSKAAEAICKSVSSLRQRGYSNQSIVGDLLVRWQPTLAQIPEDQKNKKLEQLDRAYGKEKTPAQQPFDAVRQNASLPKNSSYYVHNHEYRENHSYLPGNSSGFTYYYEYQAKPSTKQTVASGATLGTETFDGNWWPLMEKDKLLLDEYIKNPNDKKWRSPPPSPFRTPTDLQAIQPFFSGVELRQTSANSENLPFDYFGGYSNGKWGRAL